MKKSIFAAVILGAAVLFTACKDDKKTAVTGIQINPSELTLNTGEESRLSIVVTPEKASYNSDELVWSSSDTTVVVVSMNGTITALEEGTANITVKYKDLQSVCKVTVTPWIKNLKFTGAYVGVSDTAYYGDELDTIQSSSGESYYVKLVQAYVGLFSAGFYLNNSGEFAGASKGGIFETYAPMYFAPGWANNREKGTYFCLGEWYIYDTLYAQCMPTGQVNELYNTHMHLFLENLNKGDKQTAFTQNMKDAGEQGCTGTNLKVYSYHSTAEGYGEDAYYSSYLPDLFGVSGYVYLDDNYAASNYMQSIEGHHLVAKALKSTEADSNNNFYGYGCHWHFDEASETYSWVDETIAFEDPYVYDRNLDVFQSAPARERGEKLYKPLTKVHDMAETKLFREKINSLPRDTKFVK